MEISHDRALRRMDSPSPGQECGLMCCLITSAAGGEGVTSPVTISSLENTSKSFLSAKIRRSGARVRFRRSVDLRLSMQGRPLASPIRARRGDTDLQETVTMERRRNQVPCREDGRRELFHLAHRSWLVDCDLGDGRAIRGWMVDLSGDGICWRVMSVGREQEQREVRANEIESTRRGV